MENHFTFTEDQLELIQERLESGKIGFRLYTEKTGKFSEARWTSGNGEDTDHAPILRINIERQ